MRDAHEKGGVCRPTTDSANRGLAVAQLCTAFATCGSGSVQPAGRFSTRGLNPAHPSHGDQRCARGSSRARSNPAHACSRSTRSGSGSAHSSNSARNTGTDAVHASHGLSTCGSSSAHSCKYADRSGLKSAHLHHGTSLSGLRFAHSVGRFRRSGRTSVHPSDRASRSEAGEGRGKSIVPCLHSGSQSSPFGRETVYDTFETAVPLVRPPYVMRT